MHYAVPNMPGSVPRTSSRALAGLTLPYLLRVANEGLEAAVLHDNSLRRAVNVYRGTITHQGVAESLGVSWTPISELIESVE